MRTVRGLQIIQKTPQNNLLTTSGHQQPKYGVSYVYWTKVCMFWSVVLTEVGVSSFLLVNMHACIISVPTITHTIIKEHLFVCTIYILIRHKISSRYIQ